MKRTERIPSVTTPTARYPFQVRVLVEFLLSVDSGRASRLRHTRGQ